MSERTDRDDIDWSLTTWEGSRRAQLELWASMSLDQILEAQEEMAELSRDLARQAREISTRATSPTVGTRVAERRATYAVEEHDLALAGCTPEPLMSYLKALGVLRLVSEQKDEAARGWWMNDVFRLRSPVLFEEAATEESKCAALVRFLVDEYKPTPIVGPWAGGSGFFAKAKRKENKKEAVDELAASSEMRLEPYTNAIRIIQAIVRDENVVDNPKDEEKARLIRRYRRELPDQIVAWMDVAMVLRQEGQHFAPLLGTGGNDGRLDFTQNFMQRIVTLGLHKRSSPSKESLAWLTQALFGVPAMLESASVGQFAPGRVGGPNATQGMEGGSTDNPWDFVLMLEGSVLLAGAAVRQFGLSESSRAAFPFTVRAIAAGFSARASSDEDASRGELWLPLWDRPTTRRELTQLFGEGRAEVSGRPARNGADFARAVAALGVDRGISEFSRVGFFKRSGKAFLATPLGRFAVVERSDANLLCEIDFWLDRYRSACSAADAPLRLRSSLLAIDAAIFDFCKYGGPRFFQQILIAVGAAERVVANAERFREGKQLRPLAALSPEWVKASDDATAEFAIAHALASMSDPQIGPIRSNLEAVVSSRAQSGAWSATWAEKHRAVVWNGANLDTNLVNVLRRRIMDGARAGCEHLPLASHFQAPLDAVSAFLGGELDERRIEDLIWGLMLIREDGGRRVAAGDTDQSPLPRAYALLKLLYLPRPLVVERRGDGRLFGRLQRQGERGGVVIRPEEAIPYLLRGGKIGEACKIAMRRLRASGLNPMPRPTRGGGVRDRDWQELDRSRGSANAARRLAAALLIPIGDDAISRLVRLVIHSYEGSPGSFETSSAVNLEGDTAS